MEEQQGKRLEQKKPSQFHSKKGDGVEKLNARFPPSQLFRWRVLAKLQGALLIATRLDGSKSPGLF